MRLLRFKGPRPQLPQGMTKPKELIGRFNAAKERKLQAESSMKDAYKFALPQRENFNDATTELDKKNLHLFDSTAVMQVPKFATRVQGILTPPWREYSQLAAGPDVPREIRERPEVKVGMKDATETLFSYMNHSNIHTQEHEAYQDLAIGTGAINFWQGGPGKPPFLFDAIAMSELVLEEGPQSTIETTWRMPKVPIMHVQRLWPGAVLSNDQAKLLKDKPQEKVELIEGVIFDPDTERFFGVLLDPSKEARIMWQTWWPVSPRHVFRWNVAPGEIYGRGPVFQLLPDIKTANKVVEFILRAAAIKVSGVYTSTDDSATNPFAIRITPASVIPVQSNDSRNPTLRALEFAGDIGLGWEVLDQLRVTIREGLLAKPQLNPEGPVRSATEVAIEDRRDIQEVGGSYGRLQTELIVPRMARATQILGDQGRIPPVRVDGRTITLKHRGELARAQDQEELISLTGTLEATAPLGPEVTAMGIKVEDVSAWTGEKMGLDPRLIRSPEEREQLKQQAQQLIEENRQAAPAAA